MNRVIQVYEMNDFCLKQGQSLKALAAAGASNPCFDYFLSRVALIRV